jgi:small-conductance mechanosensitive channel
LLEIVTAHSLVKSEPAPFVEVLDLAATSVNLAVRAWVHSENYEPVRSDLLEQINLCLK